MKDLSYSDRDRLRRLNAILVTELTMNFSDIEKLRYLNAILLTEFKNFIQKENNFEVGDDDESRAESFKSREGVRGVAGVAAATPFFEPEKIRYFVFSFLRLIKTPEKKILLHHF